MNTKMSNDMNILLGVAVFGFLFGAYALQQARRYRDQKSRQDYSITLRRGHQTTVTTDKTATAENSNNESRSNKMLNIQNQVKRFINRLLGRNTTEGLEDLIKPTEYFAEIYFLNSNKAELFQVEKEVVDKLRTALNNNECGMLTFETKMKKRCVINMEFVVSVNIYRDERAEKGEPMEGVYIRLLGQTEPIIAGLEPEPFFEEIHKPEKVFAVDNDYYINRQVLLMAMYEPESRQELESLAAA